MQTVLEAADSIRERRDEAYEAFHAALLAAVPGYAALYASTYKTRGHSLRKLRRIGCAVLRTSAPSR